jgi:hypothetical protein
MKSVLAGIVKQKPLSKILEFQLGSPDGIFAYQKNFFGFASRAKDVGIFIAIW